MAKRKRHNTRAAALAASYAGEPPQIFHQLQFPDTKAPATAAPPRASFCGLPAELRVRIYELVIQSFKGPMHVTTGVASSPRLQDKLHPLAHVNRLICSEFLPMVRHLAVLEISGRSARSQNTSTLLWLEAYGDAILAHIKFFAIELDNHIWFIRLGDTHPHDCSELSYVEVLEDSIGSLCVEPGRFAFYHERYWKPNLSWAGLEFVKKCLAEEVQDKPSPHLTAQGLKRLLSAIEYYCATPADALTPSGQVQRADNSRATTSRVSAPRAHNGRKTRHNPRDNRYWARSGIVSRRRERREQRFWAA